MTGFALGCGVGHRSTLGWRGHAVPGGTSATYALAALLARDAAFAVWNVADSSTASISSSRTSVIAVESDGPVGQLLDRKGSLDLVAPDDALRPTHTQGLTFDGVDDRIGGPASLPAIATVLAIYKGTDTSACAIAKSEAAFPAVIRWVDSSASTTQSGGSTRIDGIEYLKCDAYAAAVSDGSAYIIENRGFTGGGAALWFGAAPFNAREIEGILIPVAVLDAGEGDYADALADAEAFASAIVAELGL